MQLSNLLLKNKPILIFAEKTFMRKLFAQVINKYYNLNIKHQNGNLILGQNQIIIFSFEGHITTIKKDYKNLIYSSHEYKIPFNDKINFWEIDTNKFKKQKFKAFKNLISQYPINKSIYINATDPSREGQLIYLAPMNILYDNYIKHHYSGNVYRLWCESTNSEALHEAFEKLNPSIKYKNLTYSSICRQLLDYNLGLISSIYLSKEKRDWYSLGRVQTPTLNLIVERNKIFLANKKKKTYKYYPLITTINGVEITLKNSIEYNNRIDLNPIVNKLNEELSKKPIKNLKLEINSTENYLQHRLYSLTELQTNLSDIIKKPMEQLMKHIQKAYELGIITYPRTDSNFLPTSMKSEIDKGLNSIVDDKNLVKIEADFIFNDNKISDHYAIILTSKAINYTEEEYNKLNIEEKNIYDIIKKSMIQTFYPALVSKYFIKGKYKDYIIDEVFKTVIKKNGENLKEEEVKFTNLHDEIIKKISIKQVLNKNKLPYSEKTLIRTMKKNNIGTAATRDTGNIIKTLLLRGYIYIKNNQLLTTEKGINLISQIENSLYTDANLCNIVEKLLNDNDFIELEKKQNIILQNFFDNYITNPKLLEEDINNKKNINKSM